MPAVMDSAILLVIAGIGLFSVPIIIGTGINFDVLSVFIFHQLERYPPRIDLVLSLSLLLLVFVQLLLFLHRRVERRRRHAAIGGRGYRHNRMALGAWKLPARWLIATYIVLAAILPIAALVLVSFQTFWDPAVELSRLSLRNYVAVLVTNPNTMPALLRSVELGVAGASLALLIAGFLVIRSGAERPRQRQIIDIVTSAPATIPATVFGVAALVSFGGYPFNLYGTVALLLIANVVMKLPYAMRAANPAAAQIGQELIEASSLSGAGEGRTFRRILFPLIRSGLAAGWVMLFIMMVGEVTMAALLSSSGNMVIGRLFLDIWNFGSFPQAAVLALVMTASNTVLGLLALQIGGRRPWSKPAAISRFKPKKA